MNTLFYLLCLPLPRRYTGAMTCEDYPCCGHTDADPCEPQSYDLPAFREQMMLHLMCDHIAGICDVEVDESHEWDYDDTNESGSPWCYGCDGYADETDCDGK